MDIDKLCNLYGAVLKLPQRGVQLSLAFPWQLGMNSPIFWLFPPVPGHRRRELCLSGNTIFQLSHRNGSTSRGAALYGCRGCILRNSGATIPWNHAVHGLLNRMGQACLLECSLRNLGSGGDVEPGYGDLDSLHGDPYHSFSHPSEG